MNLPSSEHSQNYLNPVYLHDFPDPFVLKYCGQYWAYCTGIQPDNRAFGILYSRDLINWHRVGSAMALQPGNHTCYWAPEVTYHNGRFLLYYSLGDEKNMHIRVAVAAHPAGPFVDSGRRLTKESFAIDPHIFQGEGKWYLFYATDFLDHSHIGTGTVCDELLDPFTPAGQPQPVTRACYDWQVYDPHRIEKGGVRWHTVEGPFVLKHKGRYYQMFSGGNWQNPSYGVGYAVSDTLTPGDEWTQICDGKKVPPILRTIPEQVIGPGHNSVVRGPDNRQLYCIYHRWAQDGKGRLLAVDPLEWVGDRMTVLGPSNTPRAIPLQPTFAGFADEQQQGLGNEWQCVTGEWSIRDGAAIQQSPVVTAEACYTVGVPAFIAEVSVRALEELGTGVYGISLGEPGQAVALRFLLAPHLGQAIVTGGKGAEEQRLLPLPADFDPYVYHLMRLEVDGRHVRLALDDTLSWEGRLEGEPIMINLYTEAAAAAFAGFTLTVGWQDLFLTANREPVAIGWQKEDQNTGWFIEAAELHYVGRQGAGTLTKGPFLASYELVINVRLSSRESGGYGFYPAVYDDERGPLLVLERNEAGWVLQKRGGSDPHRWPLPPAFEPTVYQQFRCRKEGERLLIYWGAELLGEMDVPAAPARIGLYVERAVAAFDMVRVTEI